MRDLPMTTSPRDRSKKGSRVDTHPDVGKLRKKELKQFAGRLTNDLAFVNVRLERANLSFATALLATLEPRSVHGRSLGRGGHLCARHCLAARAKRRPSAACARVRPRPRHRQDGPPFRAFWRSPVPHPCERRVMETHSEIGERILAKVEDYAEIARIVRHHHERWDGQGYPDGLRAEDIPLLSRVIAVPNAYNALTSDRPHRNRMPSRIARNGTCKGSGVCV